MKPSGPKVFITSGGGQFIKHLKAEGRLWPLKLFGYAIWLGALIAAATVFFLATEAWRRCTQPNTG